MKTTEQDLLMLENDPDYILRPRHHSLERLVAQYEGQEVPADKAAAALGVSVEEYESLYDMAVEQLKELLCND